MSSAQSRFASDMMAEALLASWRFGKRQLQLDYRHLFRRLVIGSDLTRSIEIGAFDAGFSHWLKRVRPGISALTYKANPHVVEEYGPAAQEAGVDHRHGCVADQNGIVTLGIPRDFRGSPRDRVNQMSSLLSGVHSDQVEDVVVPSVRLDQDIDLAPVDRLVLWIDVEGALARVLPDTGQDLSRTALVNIEVERNAIWEGQWLDTDAASFLMDRGFLFLARDQQSPHQCNCTFALPDIFDLTGATRVLKNFHSASFTNIEAGLQYAHDAAQGAQ